MVRIFTDKMFFCLFFFRKPLIKIIFPRNILIIFFLFFWGGGGAKLADFFFIVRTLCRIHCKQTLPPLYHTDFQMFPNPRTLHIDICWIIFDTFMFNPQNNLLSRGFKILYCRYTPLALVWVRGNIKLQFTIS